MLLKGLPPDSAFMAGEARWTRTDEFLAAQLELTDGWSRLLFAAAGGKPKGKPLRIERPALPDDDKPEKKEIETDTMKIARWFAIHSGA